MPRAWSSNDGSGGFVLVANSAVSAVTVNSNAVACGDLNGDGRLDIVIANGESATTSSRGTTADPGLNNEILLNGGGGMYSLVQGTSVSADGFNTNTIAWGD